MTRLAVPRFTYPEMIAATGSEAYADFLRQEAGAIAVGGFYGSIPPAILQTPRFAEAVVRHYAGPNVSDETVQDAVDMRLSRQHDVAARNIGRNFIVGEAALRETFGATPEVHTEQLDALAESGAVRVLLRPHQERLGQLGLDNFDMLWLPGQDDAPGSMVVRMFQEHDGRLMTAPDDGALAFLFIVDQRAMGVFGSTAMLRSS